MDDLRDRLQWFKAVILPHEGALRARLRSLRQRAEDLDDVVAEVLTRAYANPRWREIEWGRSHLLAIARNLLIDQVRREKIVSFDAVVDLDQFQAGFDLEAQLCARDELRHLESVIAAMPSQAARVLILRRVEQKSPGQIAEEMGLSVSTVEKHLNKAIRLLMRAMADQEATDQAAVGQEAGSGEPGRSEREGRDRAESR